VQGRLEFSRWVSPYEIPHRDGSCLEKIGLLGNAEVGFLLARCRQVESNSIGQSVKSRSDYCRLD